MAVSLVLQRVNIDYINELSLIKELCHEIYQTSNLGNCLQKQV